MIIALVAAEIGVWVLPGVAVLAVVVPLQLIFGYRINLLQTDLAKVVAKRVALIGGILDAIKIVKYNTWELFFVERVRELRKSENRFMRIITMFRTLNFMFSFCTPMLVALAAFGAFYMNSGATVVAVTSFTVLSIANSLRYPLFLLPTSTKAVTGARVALLNVEKYLIMEEVGGERTVADLAKSVTALQEPPRPLPQSEVFLEVV